MKKEDLLMDDYRKSTVEYLKNSLMGPTLDKDDNPDFRRDYQPSIQYSLGKLYPQGCSTEKQVDMDDSSVNDSNYDSDPLNLSFERLPSSTGISICVSSGASIEVSCGAARYKRIKSSTDDHWERTTFRETVNINSSFTNQLIMDAGIQLHVRSLKLEDQNKEILTLSLTNTLEVKEKQGIDQEAIYYRLEMRCKSISGIICPYPASFKSSNDEEEDEMNFLYRKNQIYGSGHGCSVGWSVDSFNLEKGAEVYMDFMPEAKMFKANFFHEKLVGLEDSFNIQFFANSELLIKDANKKIQDFLQTYEYWIDEEVSIIKAEGRNYPTEVIENLINKLKNNLARMQEGLIFISENSLAFKAFQLANKAMLMQMIHGNSDIKPRSKDDLYDLDFYQKPDYFKEEYSKFIWRPFQLGFFLLTAESTANENHAARDTIDLIWYPTGGGKTEAYLFLIAFEIIYRRLSNLEDGGVVAIMRYSLRLLTQDQFSRAASLICSLEKIRRDMAPDLGNKEISLGLWAGGDLTPNNCADAFEGQSNKPNTGYQRLLELEQPTNPFTLMHCPWCRTKIVPDQKESANYYGIRSNEVNFNFFCPSEACEFHEYLPLNIVDEMLYKNPPTFLIGTIDKFALLTWRDEPGVFFGSKEGTSPPSLIIQDELHLITGPLGSIAGVYEAAFDTIIKSRKGKPKYIAATATIRGSQTQCKLLYDRNVNLFPASGSIAEDSFFSTPSSEDPGRLYIGIMTQGESAQTTTTRISAAALQSTQEILTGNSSKEKIKDSYKTLVIYHNSLKELGRTMTLCADDIPDRIKVLQEDPSRQREIEVINGVRELSSKPSAQELIVTREAMNYDSTNSNFIDVLATSVMISVGIDVSRLGFMEIVGQPKTTAELIQASSRVGRGDVPGLVLLHLKSTDARDRSHFEQFKSYIESAYRFVEPSSVTPYSLPSRERCLHAALIAVMRHSDLNMSKQENANQFDLSDPNQKLIVEDLKLRMKNSDPSEAYEIERHLNELSDHWKQRLDKSPNLLYKMEYPRDGLIKAFGDRINETDTWQTLTSMRNVDTETEVEAK